MPPAPRLAFRPLGIALLVGAMTVIARPEPSAASVFETVPPSIRRYGLTSRDNLLSQAQLWVNSGGLTVNPSLGDVAGLGELVAPPWTTAGHRLNVTFNGVQPAPMDYLWLPGELQRRAHLADGMEIHTLVSPLFGQRGLLEWVELRNPSSAAHTVAVRISSEGSFGREADGQWTFGSVTRLRNTAALRLEALRPGWAGTSAVDGTWIVGCTLPGVRWQEGAFSGAVDLGPGQARSFAVVVGMGTPAEARALAQKAGDDPAAAIAFDRNQWAALIVELYTQVPRVTSSNRALVDFYDRSLLSYPVARWVLPELAAHPWYATSGVDGGAMCAYLWDYSYTARLNALVSPESDRDLIRLFLRTDLSQGYALLPFSAKIVGAHYSYNDYALIRLIYHYVLLTGDRAFLSEVIDGRTVWERAYAAAVYRDDLAKPVALIDYGTNENLLELKLTDNYTHYVPSPNAERCWSYRAVDEMAGWAGRPSPGLTHRAVDLARVIRDRLWSPTDRWFASLDLKGKPHLGYSIQVFDLLRLDMLDTEERAGMVSHLNEREFLSPWGVHSYSMTAPGYSPHARVDWGGPGVYTGDAPELVADLLHAGYARQADEVFSRILWWGQAMPYYPQAIRADARDYRRDGRANVIAGATGADMTIFGLLGLQVAIDGGVTIDPHLPAFTPDLGFAGVVVRGHHFDVGLDAGGYHLRVRGRKTIDARYGTATALPDDAR
jgi:hypothetical protein